MVINDIVFILVGASFAAFLLPQIKLIFVDSFETKNKSYQALNRFH